MTEAAHTSDERTSRVLDASPSFAISTLGCKINQYDSNRIVQQMLAAGFQQVPFADWADVYIVDTCTVTHVADQKSRNMASRAIRRNPDAVLAVTGCGPTWSQEPFLRIHQDAIVVGNTGKDSLPNLILKALHEKRGGGCEQVMPDAISAPVVPLGSRTRAVLKVMEGCNRVCSFCIVPRVRGKPYSRPLDELVEEARRMADAGIKEIVVTGVIAGWYGTDLDPLLPDAQRRSKRQLHVVVRALQELDGLARIRMSTIDPRDLTEDLVAAMADCDKVTPYVNLALQSGCDAMLTAMRRGYTTARYRECVDSLRSAMPDIGLHTDIMVGFPGETDALFEETLAFVKEVNFSSMHVFPFSPRPGTSAPDLPDQVPQHVAAERGKVLSALSGEMKARFARRYVGSNVTILVERTNEEGDCFGFTENYIAVRARSSGGVPPDTLLEVRAEEWDGERLVGVSINQ